MMEVLLKNLTLVIKENSKVYSVRIKNLINFNNPKKKINKTNPYYKITKVLALVLLSLKVWLLGPDHLE